MISVFLCDAQPIVHQGLGSVLGSSEDFLLAGGCGSIADLGVQIRRTDPAMLLIDRGFGMHTVMEWIGGAREAFPSLRVVIWAASVSDVESFRALQAGARAIINKSAPMESLFACLHAVARGEIWTENLHADRDSALGRPRSRPLTPREQEVAALVSKGMKNREIAESLGIATGTVKIHLMHIFEKTGIRDRFELALHGLRLACDRAEISGEPKAAASVEPAETPAEPAHAASSNSASPAGIAGRMPAFRRD
jgi:DNA-binding NarL/FixJ family response regulator